MSQAPDQYGNGDSWYASRRLGGLRRFAASITAFTVLGHLWFGFEQSYAQPIVAMAAAYALHLLLEISEARSKNRAPAFAGGPLRFLDFMLPAHIPAMACAMLLYANERLMPIAFAVTVAIASKTLLRVRMGSRSCHVFNPSNLGISVTLILFPWVGIAPPYMFTENLSGAGDWILPALIVVLGSFINTRFSKRIPMILAWLSGFAAQALVRSWLFGTPLAAALLPMTGVAFLLFTFYMMTDPPTSPAKPKQQVVFGLAVAAVYGLLVTAHIVFGLFFALTIVCGLRGTLVAVRNLLANSASEERKIEAPAVAPDLELGK